MKNFKRRLETRLLKLAFRLMHVYWRIVQPITLGVRVLAIREGQVLLVRHTYQQAWYLPGGGVKRGESTEQTAIREAREECGAVLGDLHLWSAAYQPYAHKNDHVIYYRAECVRLEPKRKRSREIERFAFFPLDQLPPEISPDSQVQIETYRQQAGRSELTTSSHGPDHW